MFIPAASGEYKRGEGAEVKNLLLIRIEIERKKNNKKEKIIKISKACK